MYQRQAWHQKLSRIIVKTTIVTITTVIVGAIFAPFSTIITTKVSPFWNNLFISHSITVPSGSSSDVPSSSSQKNSLAPSYIGDYNSTSQYTSDGQLSFLVQTQDGQGNITTTITYNNDVQNDQYSCSGKITEDEHILLTCQKFLADTSSSSGSLTFTFSGLIYTDKHIEATEKWSDNRFYKDILTPS